METKAILTLLANSTVTLPSNFRILITSCAEQDIQQAGAGGVGSGLFNGHTDRVNSVAFSPDGKRIVSGSNDDTIRVWDAVAGDVVAELFDGHTFWVQSTLSRSLQTGIISWPYDQMWDANSGEVKISSL